MSLARPISRTIQDYRYERLRDRKNGIRLARIKPGAGRTRIAIELVESWLAAPGQQPHEEYQALSYTWGDLLCTKTILCNDRPLAVTENLLDALQRFRDPDNIITLWIDQICIWQDNPQEKNSQVKMMKRIYIGARKVLVWLGDHDGDSQMGMALAEQLRRLCASNQGRNDPSLLDSPGLPRRGDRKWRALAAVLDRPWFHRTWVVQEVCMNDHVELILGGNVLQWNDLEAIVRLLNGPPAANWHHDPSTSAWELPFSRINRIRQRHLQSTIAIDMVAEPSTYEPSSDREQVIDMDLLDLLLMSRHLGASKPQDKLYALLGLSNHDIEPDYSCSPEHIFTEFARHIVGEVTRLAVATEDSFRIHSATKEARQALTLLSCSGYHNKMSSLQTWVPDWTTDLLSRPLIFDSRFCAGGDELEIDWKLETGLLQLHGKLLDTVSIAGTMCLETSTAIDARDAIDRWWSEAKGIANARIVQSPGSTARVDAFNGLQRDLGLCSEFSCSSITILTSSCNHRGL